MKRFVLLIFLFCGFLHYGQEQWKLKKDANNIKIFVRNTPHSNFDEYKATTILYTSIEHVLNELLSAPEYNHSKIESGISYYIKKRGDNEHVFYVKKELPWPLKNRDIVTLLTVKRISETKIKLILEGLPSEIGKSKNTLRIKTLMGHWLLETEGNTTKVTQQLHLNPEGKIPPFVSNLLLVKGPYSTFLDLKKLENSSS
ncbi:START domain-containing protein [Hyunsoonleella pacifica]|uniref:START domain-containing protein n=1 Tax=Hyunsoonleella pacifica TaxID=1080224 RepID=A0A4Q9FN99_9FLAO|nr:START domain-containing protein [Hyunsoonleella pacifica]TBN14656.1 hypothetical protein EYD46_13895 [Hyunsoonleella pacifica]GGD15600.1 hypothetical protein GCM10011368_16950 [Hyunsoonleella pacifica]